MVDVEHFRELLVEKREAVAAALENLHKENARRWRTRPE